jgi:hypothetical protein
MVEVVTSSSSTLTLNFSKAFCATIFISSFVKERNLISIHRLRKAGLISLGSLVVAPTNRKSAGKPFSKISLIYSGINLLLGS